MSYDQVLNFVLENKVLVLSLILGAALIGALLILRRFRKIKQDVQRRVMADPGTFKATQLSASARVSARAARIAERMASLAGDNEMSRAQTKQLRGKLIQLGFYDRQAVTVYFGLRFLCAIGCAAIILAVFFIVQIEARLEAYAFGVIVAAMVGYFLPASILSRMLEKAHAEHRGGFPDCMDLMVVCAQAGLSMEAGIAKIARELASSYPSLARNLEFTSVEMRSGKNLTQAIDSLGKRLGIEEAKSFATLLTQSEELGANLSQSLRTYSDDMRNKRLMKAEEKAFALPAKMVVPLTLFVFPTLLVVLLLPEVISVSESNL